MNKGKAALYLGGILVAAGLLAGKWTLPVLFSPDRHIDSLVAVLAIELVQLTAVGAGLYLLMRRPYLPGREVSLVVISTIFSLLLLESGSRIWLDYLATDDQARRYRLAAEVDPVNRQWSPHHYLNYYPTPSYRSGKKAHNSLGYRGREFSVEKPDGTFRIVVLGGSTTYTIAVEDNEKTFTRQLENILRDSYGYEAVEVINAGAGGYSSWESLINLEFRVLDLDPDLVIIYHGTNDVHTRLVEPGSYRGDNSGRRRQWSAPPVPLLIKYSYLSRIVSSKLNLDLFRREGLGSFVNAPTYQGAGSDNSSADPLALLEEHQPVFFRRNLANMVAIARANGVEVLLSTWAYSPYFDDYVSEPHYQRGFHESNAVVNEVARQYGAKLFDFAEKMPGDRKYWSDGRHVNEEGALVKASLFANYIHNSGVMYARNTTK